MRTDQNAPQRGARPNPRWFFAIGSGVVPLAMSISSAPSPNHPRILAWYASLRKPFFQPASWVFPVAWTAFEGALSYSGWRLSEAPTSPARMRAMLLLTLNIFGIGAWSRLFFKHRSLPTSTLAAAALASTTALYVREARKVDEAAAKAAVPVVAWVTFATVLTGTIWALNRR